MSNKPRVFVCMPTHDGRSETQAAFATCFNGMGADAFAPYTLGSSLIPKTFNRLFGVARDLGARTFAMLHSDIIVPYGWCKTLVDLMDRHGLACLSACVLIKDDRRVLSTVMPAPEFEQKSHPVVKHITPKGAAMLPEVFTTADLLEHLPDHGPLLINTGCMVLDIQAFLDHGWPGFTVEGGIMGQKAPEGHWDWNRPEDWAMSWWLDSVGLPYGATTAVTTRHVGRAEYVLDRAAELAKLQAEADAAKPEAIRAEIERLRGLLAKEGWK